MRFRVFHTYYGCECQCEGHRVQLLDDSGEILEESIFDFEGPASNAVVDRAVFANEFVRKFLRRHPVESYYGFSSELVPIDFHEVRAVYS